MDVEKTSKDLVDECKVVSCEKERESGFCFQKYSKDEIFRIFQRSSKIRLRTGCSNRSSFVQTVAVFVMGYGCAQRSAREWIRTVLFYGE